MSQPEKRLRQPVVVVLGHTDAGKCVSGDTLIQLADGRIVEAKTVFEKFKTGLIQKKPDGVVHEAKNLDVLSTDADGSVVSKRVSHVWKLRADRLVRVQTKAGYEVKTTPEHKFLVMSSSGEVNYVEAEKLALGDRLLLPVKSPVTQNSLTVVKERILSTLTDDFLVRANPELNRRITDFCRGRMYAFGAEIGDSQFYLHVTKGYYRARVFRNVLLKIGFTYAEGYDGIEKVKYASRKGRASHVSPWIGLPGTREQFVALLYLIGLLYGDGLAGSTHLSQVSKDIIEEYKKCLLVAFGVGAGQAWRRTSFIVSHKGGESLARFLIDIFDYPLHDKTRILHLPEIISMMPDDLVAAFLRGFFDAKGFVQSGRNIGVKFESIELMKQIPMLLQRFGCLAYFGKGKHSKEILISGNRNISAFLVSVGFHDRSKMDAARTSAVSSETNRVFELTSIPEDFIRSVRADYSVLWDRHFQLTSCERYDRLSKDLPTRMFDAVPTYENERLSPLLENYSMVRVSGLENLEGEFTVFDFTVPDTHNFLANGLTVHNTSLLDKIRGTGVQAREAGGITQEIGASFFPMETLESICGPILTKTGGELKIPGLLVIDTPGHEVFSNLRQRGGSAADIAIVVVDVQKGLENQTLESIGILKQRRVPFLVALNKIDMIRGWRKESKGYLLSVLKEQPPEVSDELEERLYNVVGGLSGQGFESDAFYRVKDFRKQVSIVPVSARYGVGIPELLAMLIGLAQQFLQGKLAVIEEKSGGRGIILELQEELGIGETANVILTHGKLKVGDRILVVKRDGGHETRVKALFMPKPLDEMRDPRDKFTSVEEVFSAAGVKLVSPDLEGVIPGTPVIAFSDEQEYEAAKADAEKDLLVLGTSKDTMGVTVKASSIGALEALLKMLKDRNIPVRLSDIGDISKTDIAEATMIADHDPYLGVILGFDVKVRADAKESASQARLFLSEVIYEVIENYKQWAEQKRSEDERMAISSLMLPAKIKALPGNFFRRNDPAIFGVEVLAGRLRPKTRLMSADGKELGVLEQIQDQGKPIEEARVGAQVAISVKGPTLGRQIKENDDLYTFPTSHEARLLRTKFANSLSEDDRQALEEIVGIRSALDPLYGF